MKRALHAGLLSLSLIACVSASAAEPQPTEASVRELLSLSRARSLVDNMSAQLDDDIRRAVQQMLPGQSMSPAQKAIIERMQARMQALFKAEFSWERIEGLYVQLYREQFTQAEIDGQIAFYKSPAGRAALDKMPALMQRSVVEMQKRMVPMSDQMRRIQQEAQAELAKLSGK